MDARRRRLLMVLLLTDREGAVPSPRDPDGGPAEPAPARPAADHVPPVTGVTTLAGQYG